MKLVNFNATSGRNFPGEERDAKSATEREKRKNEAVMFEYRFENRISEYFAEPIAAPAFAGAEAAFVACPAPLFATFTATHQAFVAEIYRRAQELTENQFRKPARRPIPQFSLN